MDRVMKDKIKALRLAGQSYGAIAKVLALSENTVKSYCRRNDLQACNIAPILISTAGYCKQCKAALLLKPKSKPKQFCSEACRRKWWKENADKSKKNSYYSLICVHCQKPFESYGNKNRKYCSHDCYVKHRFQKEGLNVNRTISP